MVIAALALLAVSTVGVSRASVGEPPPSDLLRGAGSLAAGLQTGSRSHTLPLDLPPAPRGTAPALALVANHQVNDGIMGKGWTLSGLSRIDRTGPSKGTPRLLDAPLQPTDEDRYFVDGVELVADAGPWHPDCALRMEADDNRCFGYSLADNTWVARMDGWTWVWGEHHADGTDHGRCATEAIDEPLKPLCEAGPLGSIGDDSTGWLLSRVIDPSGNEIRIDYTVPHSGTAPGDLGVALNQANLDPAIFDGEVGFTHLPSRVRYGGGTSVGTPTVEVEFEYDHSRPDERASSRTGLLRVLQSRLTAIGVYGNGAGTGMQPIGRYHLDYWTAGAKTCDGAATLPPPPANLSLLQRITMVDPTGPGRSRPLRCMEYGDEATEFDLADVNGFGGQEIGAHQAGGGGLDVVDNDERGFVPAIVNFDGDSLPDLAYIWSVDCDNYPTGTTTGCTTQHKVFVNQHGPSSGELQSSAAQSAFLENVIGLNASTGDNFIDDGGAYLIVDLDRDGKDEIITHVGGTQEAHEFDPSAPGAAYTNTTSGWTALSWEEVFFAQLVDINGDGHLDLLFPPAGDSCPEGGSGGPSANSPCRLDTYRWIPNRGVALSDPLIRWS